MRKFIYIFFIILASATRPSVAQNSLIDSLLKELKTDKEDTNKINHLYTLCRQYKNSNEYDKGLLYGKQALSLASIISNAAEKSTNNPLYKAAQKGMAQSYNNIGNIYDSKGNYSEAFKNHFAALKIREELKDIRVCSVNCVSSLLVLVHSVFKDNNKLRGY